MRCESLRAAVAAMIVALLLAGCSQDIRDVKLSEMNQPENAKKLLEDLTVEERNAIAYYVGERTARGDIDFKMTIGDVLELAAKEKAEAEERRIQAEAARASFLKQRAEADQKRLGELMDQPVIAIARLPARQAREHLSEILNLKQKLLERTDYRDQSALTNQFNLVQEFIYAGLTTDATTLRDAWDQAEQDPDGLAARLKEAQPVIQRNRILSTMDVRSYARNWDIRNNVNRHLTNDERALVQQYVETAKNGPDVAAAFALTISEVLRNAPVSEGQVSLQQSR